MDRKEHFCSTTIRVFERSLTKISKRLAKRNLAIPNMHDERRQPIKKKKKRKRGGQRRGNPTTGRRIFHVTRAEGGKNFQTVQVKNKVTRVSCMNNSKR